jgi:hypothetical protein
MLLFVVIINLNTLDERLRENYKYGLRNSDPNCDKDDQFPRFFYQENKNKATKGFSRRIH